MELSPTSLVRLAEILQHKDKNHLLDHVEAEIKRVEESVPAAIKQELEELRTLKNELANDFSDTPAEEAKSEEVKTETPAETGDGAGDDVTDPGHSHSLATPSTEPAAVEPTPDQPDTFWAGTSASN